MVQAGRLPGVCTDADMRIEMQSRTAEERRSRLSICRCVDVRIYVVVLLEKEPSRVVKRVDTTKYYEKEIFLLWNEMKGAVEKRKRGVHTLRLRRSDRIVP